MISARRDILADVLPPLVSAVEMYEDPAGVTLYPEEEACVAGAVRNRRHEFSTGRHCARAALAGLGMTPSAITQGARGAPQWPKGVVGSITHCAGFRAAAVARAADLITIGIDAEPNEPLPARVLDRVSVPRERAMLAGLAAAVPGVAWDRLLFSAKESVYKAWAPLTASFLDFDGADITIDPGTARFFARLDRGELHGRYVIRDGLVVTAIARTSANSFDMLPNCVPHRRE